MLISYVLLIATLGYSLFDLYVYLKNKKKGQLVVIKPFAIIASVVVFFIALYSIVTGQSYEDIISMMELNF